MKQVMQNIRLNRYFIHGWTFTKVLAEFDDKNMHQKKVSQREQGIELRFRATFSLWEATPLNAATADAFMCDLPVSVIYLEQLQNIY